ncbi:hypothetical protein McanMca71_000110 [Microsporum canis]
MENMSKMSRLGVAPTPRGIPRWKLLEGLPEGTPRVEYSNMEELHSVIEAQAGECYRDNTCSPFLIVLGIPDTVLEEFDSIYQDKGPRVSANIHEKTLIIETMVGHSHERLTQRIGRHVTEMLLQMGIRKELGELGAGRDETQGLVYVKEPDLSWVLDGEQWPTLVLEVGWSEKAEKLASDAHGWLETEGSATEVVITAKLDQDCAHIDFAVWELASEPARTTRSYRKSAQQTQRVEVSRKGGDITASSSLVVSFKKIFRREPAADQEGDLIFTKERLIDIAEWAWAEVGSELADYEQAG